jgi:hypothetical protein
MRTAGDEDDRAAEALELPEMREVRRRIAG